jgi:hypothetical protein
LLLAEGWGIPAHPDDGNGADFLTAGNRKPVPPNLIIEKGPPTRKCLAEAADRPRRAKDRQKRD